MPELPKWLVRLRIERVEVSEERDDSSEYVMSRPLVRTKQFLDDARIASLVGGYQAGRTVYELAEEFGVSRQRIALILKRAGVRMRMQGLDESQRVEIARLRGQGWSFARLGDHFGVDGCTVRRFLARSSRRVEG